MPMASATLQGTHVRLEPLNRAHFPALVEIGLDPDLWQWTVSFVRTRADMVAYLEQALAEQAHGRSLPFATIDQASAAVVGCTRFGSIEPLHRRVEIGWTWVARPWQRTAINTEAKYLMLEHAFERLQCVRVELKTDALNRRSRDAIVRLGAVEEGVLRSHMITASGRVRDTVYYSILATEWPDVRARLQAKVARSNHSTDTSGR